MSLTTPIKGNPILQPAKSKGMNDESEMLVFQIRCVSKDHLVGKLRSIGEEELQHSMKTLSDILEYRQIRQFGS